MNILSLSPVPYQYTILRGQQLFLAVDYKVIRLLSNEYVLAKKDGKNLVLLLNLARLECIRGFFLSLRAQISNCRGNSSNIKQSHLEIAQLLIRLQNQELQTIVYKSSANSFFLLRVRGIEKYLELLKEEHDFEEFVHISGLPIQDPMLLKIISVAPQAFKNITEQELFCKADFVISYGEGENLSKFVKTQSSMFVLNEKVSSLYLFGEALARLSLCGCEASCLVISGTELIKQLNLPNNQLRTIRLLEYPLLEELDISGNPIQEINLSTNSELTTLCCNRTEISIISLQNNTQLKSVSCYKSPVYEIIMEELQQLRTLDISDTRVENLDIEKMPNLEYLYIFGSRISPGARYPTHIRVYRRNRFE